MVVTYHPAYLLRSPGEKRKSWQDLGSRWSACAMAIAREALERPEYRFRRMTAADVPAVLLVEQAAYQFPCSEPVSANLVRFRAMTPFDVTSVGAVERSSYPFPWSESIFRDCLRVGYLCRVAESVGAGGARHPEPRCRRGARAQPLRAPRPSAAAASAAACCCY